MPTLVPGQRTWQVTRDTEGHREYRVKHLVRAETVFEGPGMILQTPGLPIPGAWWIIDDDIDLWAWCRANAEVKIHQEREGDPNIWWTVEQLFSTKPPDRDQQRCQDAQIQDPLLEPPKISGGFIKYTEEATKDRFGKAIVNSAHEQLRGPQVEFDRNRPTIRIEHNVPSLQLELVGPMIDTLNQNPLWGLPPRCIKLSNFSWERKYYGQCYIYYTRIYEFDVNAIFNTNDGTIKGNFDRDILDEGTKVLNGHWDENDGSWVLDPIDGVAPSPGNPTHFIKAKDYNGENMRIVLNGRGLPAGVMTSTGDEFISIVDDNLNNSVLLSTKWIPYHPLSYPPPLWQHGARYEAGNVVESGIDGLLYLFINSTIAQNYSFVEPPFLLGVDWLQLTFGLNTQLGAWNAATTYLTGDVVVETIQQSDGNIHVEKYTESDFLQLGIPTVL